MSEYLISYVNPGNGNALGKIVEACSTYEAQNKFNLLMPFKCLIINCKELI